MTLNTAVASNCRLMGVMVVSSVQVHSPSPLPCAYIRGLPPLAQMHILTLRYSYLGDLSLLPLCCCFLPFPTQALRAHRLREQLPPNLVCLVILLGIGGR
jgi:hypothetical protein